MARNRPAAGLMADWFDALLADELSRLAESGLLRHRRVVRPIDAVHVEIDGRVCVNFCSNNYLGLTHHPRVVAGLRAGAERFGAGAGAAGLISGFSPQHAATEAAIALWKSAEGAMLLPSGYQANLAAVQTLAALGRSRPGGVRFLIDKLAHASLVDAVRGSGAPWRVFPHNHMGKLGRLLEEADDKQFQVVVTESIFSMDGDEADLAGLDQLKRARPFALLLDEAHASGVYGRAGAGLAAERGLAEMADVFVVTFSKAAGCVGGAICGKENFCRAVLNFGRAYVYSTSVPAAMAASIEAAIGVMRDEPGRQDRVRELSRTFRAALRGKGRDVAEGDSPIVPIIVGSESAAMEMSQRLLDGQLLVGAVRPPTVPRGTSRLRVTLSCEHTEEEIARLTEALAL
ncbi:MAG: aminotransferase class I/II-fold pyridoxal phosphate-dependent enzyme [Tepidisphaeraceae bacterium]|jgi:8-amino-7-oxononanoate synthase